MTADTASHTARQLADATAFLSALLDGLPRGYLAAVWTLPTKRTAYIRDASRAAVAVVKAAIHRDVYIHAAVVSSQKAKAIGGGRRLSTKIPTGGEPDARADGLLALVVEFDVKGAPDRHGGVKKVGAPSKAAIVAFLSGLPSPPTFIIDSGGGIHAWWVFDEPWLFTDDAERRQAEGLAKQFQQWCRDESGFAIDSTADLSHLFRIPGTANHKASGDPRPVTTLCDGPSDTYAVADLRTMVAHVTTPQEPAKASSNGRGDVPADRLAVMLELPGVAAVLADPPADGGESARDLAVAKEAMRAGASDAEAAALVRSVREDYGDEKGKADRHDYIDRTIRRARAEVTAEDAGVVPATASAIKPECLVEDVAGFVGQFVVMTPEKLLAVALWVIHTHCVAQFDQTPYLAVTSPEKQCGKSRLLEVLELLVHRPWQTVLPSEAVVFRTIDSKVPTMLLDETDAIFNPKSAERYEGLRAILNSGHRRGAMVARCVGPRQQLQDFSTFCPKVLAGIGSLPDTIADRSVPIRLERKKRGEVADRFFRREAEPRGRDLQSRMLAWCNAEGETLRAARPSMPDDLSDRMQEGCEPLVAIADVLGCGEDARAAFVELLTAERLDNVETYRLRLLRDIRDVFGASTRNISTEGLIKKLLRADESPWGSYYGRAVEALDLGRLLAPYGIHPITVRVNKARTAKGYKRDDFVDAWERYL